MTVLHVVPSFGVGGMEKIICCLIDGLPPEWSHAVVALDNRRDAAGWIRRQDVHMIDFQKPEGRAAFFRRLYGVLRRLRPDVVMTYNWGATDAIWLSRAAGIARVVHNEHGFNADEASGTLWKRDVIRAVVYRLAAKVIVVSDSLRRLMVEHFHLKQGQYRLIPNGIDLQRFRPDRARGLEVRKELGWDDTHLVVGFAGRFDAVKNFPFLLEVFAACRTQNDRFRLLLVGDGGERTGVERLCRERGVVRHVAFVGQREDVAPCLQAMDVFLLTSLREQMPISILEAMATGLPVVASAVGDIPTMIADGRDGKVLNLSAGPAAFAEAVVQAASESVKVRMGMEGRRKVAAHYGVGTMISEYHRLLLEIADASCSWHRSKGANALP